jgi:hypothetical protein
MRMSSHQIERRSAVSPGEFRSAYESAPGLPLIVTDAAERWPALRKWTFEFFDESFGADEVIVTDRVGRPTLGRRMSLREYLVYAQRPETSDVSLVASPTPLYLTTYSPFVDHPSLRDDFDDPYFLENWYRASEGALRDWYETGFGWIFIGPRGTFTALHDDLFGTHAWLAQLTGRKRCLMFPPTDAARATPFETIVEPGEVLFIPAGWVHEVEALDASITLTFNYVNASNFAGHIAAIVQQMPLWVKKVERFQAKHRLGVTWSSRGFDGD